ncbi:MAG: prepilin-type N-terminal cleavage/methylation domain-containing protein [Alphaproteobacteria bacterium]|nr:prepilin-type N-terminal cleavage/methylation domain-containing protein [Alphaproteobacteria bacterium]
MQKGFSLVELSIVLVILGLLTGGILAGQSLIHASELRAVSTEYQRYMAAAQTFRDKYFAYPGDMPNAVRFWGAQAGATTDGTDATCAALTAAATSAATCNGNGGGGIADGAAATNAHEMFRFWQHLANAGLVEGSYTGVTGVVGQSYAALRGVNIPASKYPNVGWTAVRWNMTAGPYWWGLDAGNAFFAGANATNTISHGIVMKAEDVWNIDSKMDDGKPSQGKIWVQTWTCTTAPDGTTYTGDYNLTLTTNNCSLVFRNIF